MEYPVDPMTLFYAATSAVEEGKVAEVEIEFRNDSDEIVVQMIIRKEPRPMTMFMPVNQPKEE